MDSPQPHSPPRVADSYTNWNDRKPFDAIVIGSGMGGLTAAAILAKSAGKRVLVLERHYTPGGFTHVFKRPGYEWDVGLHYIGELHHPGTELRAVFDYVTEGRVAWADVGEVYDRMVTPSGTYELVAGKEPFRARLKQYFPREKRAIDRYHMNLAFPHVHKTAAGQILNDYLRRKDVNDPANTRHLTGELFAQFATRVGS
jgi:phytoene dehydrogenase-like protein